VCRLWGHGLFPLGKPVPSLKLVLPAKAAAVLKGHKGVSKAGLVLADALVEGGRGVWEDMAQLVGENPELDYLREGVAQSLTMSKAVSTLGAYRTPVSEWQEFCSRYKGRAFPVDSALYLLFLQERLNGKTRPRKCDFSDGDWVTPSRNQRMRSRPPVGARAG